MSVLNCLKNGDGKTISIEIEPPKIGYTREDIFKTLDPLAKLGIKFIDITYHSPRIVDYVESEGDRFALYQRLHPGTSGMAGAILERYAKYKIFPVPHLICTGFSRYDTEDFLHELACLGVTNVLALRGDGSREPCGNILPFKQSPGGHHFAYELINQIVQLREGKYCGVLTGKPMDFEVGAACYPEGHPDRGTDNIDLEWLKKKADQGADYFISQMFFDCDLYEKFLDLAEAKGIKQPIIPGIKPLTIYRHLDALPKIFSCRLPPELRSRVEKFKDSKEDVRKVGIEWCIEQCIRLREIGAPSLHFYAARNAPIKEIIEHINDVQEEPEDGIQRQLAEIKRLL
ncbi:MAG: methylenetetrahydrofolate reductase (NADPH) [Chlamydiales bacterium]|jgi:methylenetetrahydrofolate reductase (NADPH)